MASATPRAIYVMSSSTLKDILSTVKECGVYTYKPTKTINTPNHRRRHTGAELSIFRFLCRYVELLISVKNISSPAK